MKVLRYSKPMKKFIKSAGVIKKGTTLSLVSEGGKSITIKCVDKQRDCLVLDKVIQDGEKELVGRFTYQNRKQLF